MNLSLEKIIIDAGTQSREKIDETTVASYADRMKDGEAFPPVVVFHDGVDYFLADGFHRYFAAKRINSPCIECEVKDGTLSDARLYSYGANAKHGLPRTNADKRKAVISAVQDERCKDMAVREIARLCNVSHPLVLVIMEELQGKRAAPGKPKASKPEVVELPPESAPEFDEQEVQKETMNFVVEELQRQNEELQDKLTVAMAGSGDELEREMAESIIKDLRAQIRALEIELKQMTISRDTYMTENAELKKQVGSLLKKLKKLEG